MIDNHQETKMHTANAAPAIIIEDQTMSDPLDTKTAYMAGLLDDDVESWSRLSGLMAMLALPPLHRADGTFRKQLVEIELSTGRWVAVDAVTIEAHRVIFRHGTNGSSVQYEFLRSEGVPKWRAPREARTYYIESH